MIKLVEEHEEKVEQVEEPKDKEEEVASHQEQAILLCPLSSTKPFPLTEVFFWFEL